MKHNAAPELEPLLRPIGELRQLPGNPRRGDVEAVARSYARFGQTKPVVALEDGTVVAGNHQYLAARNLGWTHLAVVTFQGTDAEAKAYALADNRTQELGSYDMPALLALVDEVRESHDDALLAATSWDDAVLRSLAETSSNAGPLSYAAAPPPGGVGVPNGPGAPTAPGPGNTVVPPTPDAPAPAPGVAAGTADDEWTGLTEYTQKDVNSLWRCTIHFGSEEDVTAFFAKLGMNRASSFWWPESDGHVGSSVREAYVAAEEDER